MKSIKETSSKSDKVSHHGYHRFYDLFLSKLNNGQEFNMLELGYDKGYSISLWHEFFEGRVKIDSIDILENPVNSLLNKYYKINQDDLPALDNFSSDKIEYYSFIIDDASHVPSHQWNTFLRLIKCLRPGGIYIIEDIETSFWKESHIYGIPFNALKTSLSLKLNAVFSFINNEFISPSDLKKLKLETIEINALNQIESMFIGYNCIIFTKKDVINNGYYRNFEDYKLKENIGSNTSKKKFKLF